MTKQKVKVWIVVLLFIQFFPLFFIFVHLDGWDISNEAYFPFYILAPIAVLIIHLVGFIYWYKNFFNEAEKTPKKLTQSILLNVLVVYPLLLMVFLQIVFNLNVLFDTRDDQIHFSGKVVDKEYLVSSSSRSRGTDYYISIATESQSEQKVKVPKSDYKKYEVGDVFNISFYKGRFGVPWKFKSFGLN